MKKVLVIEDEKNLSRFIELELRREAFDVSVAFDGNVGLALATAEDCDVILLDLMLPGLNGLEVCRQLRKQKMTPVIIVTAKDSVADRVAGLDCGADDYLTKPFAIEELLARMRAIFRRQSEPDEKLSFRDIIVNLETRVAKKAGKVIHLTKREFDLLVVLVKNKNRVMEREKLLDMVWGYDAAVDSNVVDTYVKYLRQKIDNDGQLSCIQTLRGIGYMMKQ